MEERMENGKNCSSRYGVYRKKNKTKQNARNSWKSHDTHIYVHVSIIYIRISVAPVSKLSTTLSK